MAALEIPVKDDTPAVRSASNEMRDTLAGLGLTPPPTVKTGETHSFVSSGNRYVLAGDLFGDANPYALVELSSDTEEGPGIALAVWRGEHWELRDLWKIQPVWRPAGWGKSDDDYLPVTPATRPFSLERLAGDAAPWVVFAWETSKYFQFHYVLRFDAATGRLRLLGEAMARPEFLPGGWLRLYYSSGHRAIFEQWNYRRWTGQDLVPCADWHDETPYNDPDSPFVEATVYGRQGDATHAFKAEMSDQNSHDPPGYRVSRDGQPFATVMFVRRHPLAPFPADEASLEEAYLFARLTGLPRWLYPQSDPSGKVIPHWKPGLPLEHFMRVRVQGNAVAVRLLATPLSRGGF